MGNTALTHDEEIRAIALEYASKMIDYANPDIDSFMANADRIANYLHKGKGPDGN